MDSAEGPTEDSRRALAAAKHLYMRIGFGARVGSGGGPPSSSSLHPLVRDPSTSPVGIPVGERDQEHPLLCTFNGVRVKLTPAPADAKVAA